jgi:hypothetical protein
MATPTGAGAGASTEMTQRQSVWLAHGVAAWVEAEVHPVVPWGFAPAEVPIVELVIESLERVPAAAEATGRPDLRFVRRDGARALTCFVGPGIQAYTAAMQLACSAAVWARGGMLIHGAGLALEGQGAVAAMAVSGGGKSTLSNLADGFLGLSDETLLLWEATPPRISATPFRSSSTREPQARTEPLRALLVLEKSLEPSFERLPAQAGVKRLLAQAYELPESIATRAEVFHRASQIAERTPTYRFAFPKAPAARDLLARLFADLGSG